MKLATLKEMLDDGWKQRTIAGVKCLVLDGDGDKLIAQWRKGHCGFSPVEYAKVVAKLGQPDKVHTHIEKVSGGYLIDTVLTIEYFV